MTQRLPTTILVIVAGSLLAFLVPRLAPGDAAAAMVGQDAPRETYLAIRSAMGLDLPFWQQYLHWIENMLRGDLGFSYLLQQPVTTLIVARLQPTVELALAGLLVMVSVGLFFASLGALSPHVGIRRMVAAGTSAILAIPSFLSGLLLIIVFGIVWPILPVSGTQTIVSDPIAGLQYLLLPAVTAALVPTAIFTKLVQAQMELVKKEEFVRTAIAKGISLRRVNYVHIMGNSFGPAIIVAGVIFGDLLGGAVIVENIFARDGLGTLAVSSVFNRDYMVVQALILFSIVAATLIQFVCELLQMTLDPRIRLET